MQRGDGTSERARIPFEIGDGAHIQIDVVAPRLRDDGSCQVVFRETVGEKPKIGCPINNDTRLVTAKTRAFTTCQNVCPKRWSVIHGRMPSELGFDGGEVSLKALREDGAENHDAEARGVKQPAMVVGEDSPQGDHCSDHHRAVVRVLCKGADPSIIA